MRGHSARVKCFDFSPDGLTIASGSGTPAELAWLGVEDDDNSVRVWDVKTVSYTHLTLPTIYSV